MAKKKTIYEQLIKGDLKSLLGEMYKMLPQYKTETEQVKDCMIKWMRDLGKNISLSQWENV